MNGSPFLLSYDRHLNCESHVDSSGFLCLVAVCLVWGVLQNVGTLVLCLVVEAQHAQLLQWEEDCGAQDAYPEDDQQSCNDLSPKLVTSPEDAIAAALRAAEESKRQETPHTACTMHWNSIDDIIQSQPPQEDRATLVH